MVEKPDSVVQHRQKGLFGLFHHESIFAGTAVDPRLDLMTAPIPPCLRCQGLAQLPHLGDELRF